MLTNREKRPPLTAEGEDIVAGNLGLPKDRAQTVAWFKLLVGRENVTWPILARCLGMSEATAKRWGKRIPDDPDATPQKVQKKKAEGTRKIATLFGKSDEDLADIFSTVEVPQDFDAIRILKAIVMSSHTPRQLKVQALRIVAAYENQRGRIPWESIKVADIPAEVQHRLAGLLIHLVTWDELPEEVKAASPMCRRVYKLFGVLPSSEEIAKDALERFAQHAAKQRARLAPVVAEVEKPALVIRLAAESGRTEPK